MSEKNFITEKKPVRDSKLFERAVTEFFEPIARKLELPLVKVNDGIYEIPSPYFILRIRHDTGHGRGLNVMLRPASLRNFEDNKPGFQLGVGCFILFQGEDLKQIMVEVSYDEDFLKEAQLLAKATERFGVPYVLGEKNDFEAVQEFMRKRSEPEVQRIREMNASILRKMGGQVRDEWPVVIPREEGEEWDTIKELKAPNIQFIGDLNGERERVFKENLAEFFKHDQSAERAYLARIIGQDLPANGALCLRPQFGLDKSMRKNIGKIFADIFSLQASFNVLFLTDEQESSLAKVCRPFFEKT